MVNLKVNQWSVLSQAVSMQHLLMVKTDITDRIRQAIKNSGMTQAQIAEKVGVSKPAVTRWLTKGSISRNSLLKLSEVTKTDFQWLVSGQASNSASLDKIRLENLRVLANAYDSLDEFAEVIGCEVRFICQRIGLSPTHAIDAQLARQIEKKLKKPERWLDTLHDWQKQKPGAGMILPEDLESQLKPYIPLIPWSLAGRDISPEQVIKYLPRWPDDHNENSFALMVKGDTMVNPYSGAPSFEPGCFIFIDPERPAINGSLVIVRLPGIEDVIFKMLIKDAGKQYLININPRYPTYELPEKATICGVIIGQYISHLTPDELPGLTA